MRGAGKKKGEESLLADTRGRPCHCDQRLTKKKRPLADPYQFRTAREKGEDIVRTKKRSVRSCKRKGPVFVLAEEEGEARTSN